MPAVMRDHLLQRLHDILTGQDADPQFARIAANDRQAILEILRETKPNLPELLDRYRDKAADGRSYCRGAVISPRCSRPDGFFSSAERTGSTIRSRMPRVEKPPRAARPIPRLRSG